MEHEHQSHSSPCGYSNKQDRQKHCLVELHSGLGNGVGRKISKYSKSIKWVNPLSPEQIEAPCQGQG